MALVRRWGEQGNRDPRLPEGELRVLRVGHACGEGTQPFSDFEGIAFEFFTSAEISGPAEAHGSSVFSARKYGDPSDESLHTDGDTDDC